jgi:hypothetical protein
MEVGVGELADAGVGPLLHREVPELPGFADGLRLALAIASAVFFPAPEVRPL